MSDARWVAAAPFRAHLHHVCASTGVPWPVVALHASLPLALVRDLLDTRPGRRVLRIAPELAAQVYDITVDSVAALTRTSVPAGNARRALRRLAALGWGGSALACRLHVSMAELDAVACGLAPRVSTLLELRLAALALTGEAAHQVGRRRPASAA